MLNIVTAKVRADAVGQCRGGQLTIRLGYGTLAMHPLRLDVVEPGTFGRQEAGDNLNALFTLSPSSKHTAVVLSQPIAYFTADMPGGVVPDEHQHPLALSSQTLTHPFQVGNSHMANRSPINEAQPHLLGVVPEQSIAAQRLGIGVVLAGLISIKLLQAQWLPCFSPSVHARLSQTAPPNLIAVANHPALIRTLRSRRNQEVASVFLRSYCGSGEVIQCLVRCHPTPNRLRAWRIS